MFCDTCICETTTTHLVGYTEIYVSVLLYKTFVHICVTTDDVPLASRDSSVNYPLSYICKY